MTRILQVSRSIIDGGFDYHAEIARAFAELGASVLTVFQRGQLDPKRTAAFPGRVVCLDARRRRRYKNKPFFSWALWRLQGRDPADLAICHHLTPAQATDPLLRFGRVRRARMVVHDYDYFDPADDKGRKRGRFLSSAIRRGWSVIGVSNAICRNIQSQVTAFPAGCCRVIPNAIDLSALRDRACDRSMARQILGLEDAPFMFGTVGRLVSFKAQNELISAFASVAPQMPDAGLIVIGRGPLKSDLQRQVRRLDLDGRVIVHGFADDAARLLRALDVFVLPSHDEPFGLVVLEAMACGVPVLASDSGGPAEILTRSDQLFPTGDVNAMAQHMLSIYRASKSERASLAEAGYRRARDGFDLSGYRAAYASLLEHGDGSRTSVASPP